MHITLLKTSFVSILTGFQGRSLESYKKFSHRVLGSKWRHVAKEALCTSGGDSSVVLDALTDYDPAMPWSVLVWT